MPQINSGKSPPWVSGEIVTASGLNGMIDSATITPSVITDQPWKTNPSLVTSGDRVLILDGVDGLLKQTYLSDVFVGGQPLIVAQEIRGGIANGPQQELSIISSDGMTIFNNDTSNPNTGLNIQAEGNLSISAINSSFGHGNGLIAINSGSAGIDITATGGTIRLNSNTQFNSTITGTQTFSGTCNFTGNFQVNGQTGYILTEIYEETIPSWSATYAGLYNSVYTSSSFTKPVDEIWVFELFIRHSGYRGYNYEFAGRYGSQGYQSGSYIFSEQAFDSQGGGYGQATTFTTRWVVPSATTLTSDTFKIDAFAGTGSQMQMFTTTSPFTNIITTGTLSASKFRIYKYKTA